MPGFRLQSQAAAKLHLAAADLLWIVAVLFSSATLQGLQEIRTTALQAAQTAV